MATVNIVIEGDDSGVSSALNQINQNAARLSSGFDGVGAASDRATGKMTAGIGQSRIVTDLLVGNISRAEQALVRLGARTELLGPLISMAFAPAAITVFADLIMSLPKGIDSVIEKITGWGAANKAMMESQGELNKSLAEMNKQIEEAQRKGAVIGMSGIGSAQASLGFAQSDVATQQQAIADLKKQMADMRNATTATDLILPSGETIGGAGPTVPKYDLSTNQDYQKLDAQLRTAQAQLKLLQQDAANTGATLHEAFGNQAVDDLMAWSKQFDELIKKNQEAGRKTTEYEDKLMNDSIQASNEYYKQLGEQSKKYAESWTRARDTMANELDSFFNELTSGNIGQAFLKQFEKLTSQMVATWLMGVQGMQGAVTRSGGLFGTLFGLGGGSGGGVFSGAQGGGIYNALPGGSSLDSVIGDSNLSSLTGLPLSAGGGAGSIGLSSLPAGASTVGGAGLGGLFSLSNLTKLLPVGALAGGTALLGKGGIAGALGGALTGFGAGAVAGPLLQSLAASSFLSGAIGTGTATVLDTIGGFLGPIGAGIGLITGLIGLFTGNGKLKEQQSQLVQQMERDIAQVKTSYDLHQSDYNSAIAADEQIRQSYTQQQEQLKKGGSAGRVDQWINDAEAAINSTEQQRQNAIAASANFGPAQFRYGGYVGDDLTRFLPSFRPAMHFATGGAVPAMLHAGEFVMRPEAVQQFGVNKLNAMNSGQGGGDVHIHLDVKALDGKSVQELFNPHGEAFAALSLNIRRAYAMGVWR